MFFRPGKVKAMWDTWLFYKDNTHYLFYLHIEKGDQWDGISLAVSPDGVHYEEIGPILRKRDDAEWMGTGSIWAVENQYILNFSEQRNGIQSIYFARSNDLIHWERLSDTYRSKPDRRWYDDTETGRWDCIWANKKQSGGFYGYLTARPWNKTPGISFESIGMVESKDGLNWHAIKPPLIEWGDWPQMNVGEVGAIEKIDKKYYLLLGYSELALGERQVYEELHPALAMVNGKYRSKGMYAFVSDKPEGPFYPDKLAYRFLVSNGAYFARFYKFEGELLVNHHSFEHVGDGGRVWMAPLKKVTVDNKGSLRLEYWHGNNAAKGEEQAIDLSKATCIDVFTNSGAGLKSQRNKLHHGLHPWMVSANTIETHDPYNGGIITLHEKFNIMKGIILEGIMSIANPLGRWGGVGFYVEHDTQNREGTGIMMQTNGRTEIASMVDNERGFFDPRYRLQCGIPPDKECHFRIIMRRTMMELYLDDILIQCYTFPQHPTGIIGLIFESGRATFRKIRSWQMNV